MLRIKNLVIWIYTVWSKSVGIFWLDNLEYWKMHNKLRKINFQSSRFCGISRLVISSFVQDLTRSNFPWVLSLSASIHVTHQWIWYNTDRQVLHKLMESILCWLMTYDHNLIHLVPGCNSIKFSRGSKYLCKSLYKQGGVLCKQSCYIWLKTVYYPLVAGWRNTAYVQLNQEQDSNVLTIWLSCLVHKTKTPFYL